MLFRSAKDYLKVLEDLKNTRNILEDKSTDKEFYEMAEKELKDLKQREEECVKRLKVFLLPKDEADEKNAIIVLFYPSSALRCHPHLNNQIHQLHLTWHLQ